VQSKALYKLVGSVYGYYPENNGVQCHIIDRTVEHLDDVIPGWRDVFFNPDLDMDEKKDKLKNEWIPNKVAFFFQMLENQLSSHIMPYFAGTMNPTVADFVIISFVTANFLNPMSFNYDGDNELLSQYPHLK
jgi:hypothetical protein